MYLQIHRSTLSNKKLLTLEIVTCYQLVIMKNKRGFFVSLLLAAIATNITSLNVYYVKPDNSHSFNNSSCTLQHYLKNASNYFTSQTHFHFLPGEFNLTANLTITNVSHFSLIGLTNMSVIYCSKSTGILVNKSNSINISGLQLRGCAARVSNWFTKTSGLSVIKSLNVTLLNLKIDYVRNNYGILLTEVFGISLVQNVTTNRIKIYNRQKRVVFGQNYLTIKHFKQISNSSRGNYAIFIALGDHGTNLYIEIMDTLFNTKTPLYINSSTSNGLNFIYITKVNFTKPQSSPGKKAVNINIMNRGKKSYEMNSMIRFTNCHFTKINFTEHLIYVETTQKNYGHFKINVVNCSFHHNYYGNVLTAMSAATSMKKSKLFITITNTEIFELQYISHVMYVENTLLLLQRMTFNSISSNRTIIEAPHSIVTFDRYMEFSQNHAIWCLIINYVAVAEHTIVNFTLNNVAAMFTRPSAVRLYTVYEQSSQAYFQCIFQYISLNTSDLDERFHQGEMLNYSIIFKGNRGNKLVTWRFALSHCSWIFDKGFKTANSQSVNQKFIHYQDNKFIDKNDTSLNTLCLCEANHTNCHVNTLTPIYPGQTIHLNLYAKLSQVVLMQINADSNMACKINITTSRFTLKLPKQTCTTVYFRIRHRSGIGCELYLQGAVRPANRPKAYAKEFQSLFDFLMFTDAFYIKLDKCPQGFAFNKAEGACMCDPYLVLIDQISISSCNVDDQTILRPANSWIFAETVNNSHAYCVSVHCPFDYCLPQASQLKLSEPNVQCQFDRVGTLCGHCKPGYSAVFSSSRCKKCSNFYIFITVPIFIAGIVLVVLLFVLNFTVTDGDLNGITFYVSIVSINDHIFLNQHSFIYTVVSLINLDLGIEMCFYNGMNNYTKMWLQLVFPFFLYCISLSIIIASRYVSVIQRITAQRALAVLATLFLLSFTKILRTTCNVLFSYSTIEHLPSKQTTSVWSVDASTPFSDIKFILLFATCVVLLMFLFLYNVMLLFTRPLLRFKTINHFKPLLDCYQGPYQSKFYFWTGTQLVARAVFFGLSALHRDTNMTVSTLLIGAIMCIHGIVYPYKSKIQNIQDLLLLLNLQGLFVLSQYSDLNHTGVTLMFSFSFLQFLLILLNHIRLNCYGKFSLVHTARAKINLDIARNCFNCRNTENSEEIQEIRDNYCMEFQEPLIGEFDT